MSHQQESLNVITGYAALKFQLAVARMSNAIVSFVALPGTGKTAITDSVAEWGADVLPPDLCREDLPAGWKPDVFSIQVPQHEDIEFHMPGIDPKTGKYTLEPSPLLTRLTEGCYQVFDEWTMEGCQRSMLQMCSGKRLKIGPFTGPKGITRVLIGNTADSGNFSFVDNSVLGNRLRQYEWTPIHTEWDDEFAAPYGVHPLLRAAIRMEGQSLFLDYDSARSRNATPRSHTEASDAMLVAEQYTGGTLTHGQRMSVLAGSLHDEAALKIQALFTLLDKITPYPAIVTSPDTCSMPTEAAAMFMTCANVSRRCEPDDWAKVAGWTTRLPLELRGSVIEPIVKRFPVLQSTPEFHKYNADTSTLYTPAP